ncbi:MAG: nuclease [Verrucomicrobiales bacterium]|nr:nuclease [Verrucomicrobiales bacterium]
MKKIVMLLALIGCCSANAENCFDAEIMKIVDGDTLDARVRLEPFSLLKEIRIRLSDIDAYESRTRDLAVKEKGLRAKSRLAELTKDGVRVCLSEKGKFGRWLGVIWAGDMNVNEQLVLEGHAVRYDGGKR